MYGPVTMHNCTQSQQSVNHPDNLWWTKQGEHWAQHQHQLEVHVTLGVIVCLRAAEKCIFNDTATYLLHHISSTQYHVSCVLQH